MTAPEAGQEPGPPASAAEPEEPPRRVRVGPEDVFQPGEVRPMRWREHSFFAPILLVVLVSAALIYGAVAMLGLAWRWFLR